ncbi:MAG TPA: plasmid pRiA4b ORF-3 family protein [Blastocatellia bacterium]|nr:plasmid pRiA4b ORF-3 family protein [Blastocatellia bacterium]
MSGKEQKASCAALVRQVVREAAEPIPVAEILRRVELVQRVETRSPEATVRGAIRECRMIVHAGDGAYGWYPRLLSGSRARVPLVTSHLSNQRIIFDDEVRELLWPGFFASRELADEDPVVLRLPEGTHTPLPLDFFGQGVWGTTGSPALWNWLRFARAKGGDALVIEAADAEKKCYRVSLEPRAQRDDAAVRGRTAAVEQAAREYLWRSRARDPALWDLARGLLVAGHYRHPVPPEPITPVWNRIHDQLGVIKATAGRRRVKWRQARRVYELKVTLPEVCPAIWRRVLVAGNTTLGELHAVIQLAMGWAESHPHRFIIDGRYYGDPDYGPDERRDGVRDEHRTTLDRVLAWRETRIVRAYDYFTYAYGSGEGWRHELIIERFLPPDDSNERLRCVAGEGGCPPEECGGAWGYAGFRAALDDPSHPEHEEVLEWAGGRYDAERCDLTGINWLLERLTEQR